MRKQIFLNTNWRFHPGDAPDAGAMSWDDRSWRLVTLPHDWAVEHPFDVCWASGTGYLPGGTAWYRKHFTLTEQEASGRVLLTFQGVYKHSKVWINSNYLGQHAYGYTSFSYDLSPFVRPGENLIAVRVEHEEVADSRWYTGSGITRHVLLSFTDPVAFGESGIFAVTESDDGNRAVLRIRYVTTGADSVRFFLRTPAGKAVSEISGEGASGLLRLDVHRPRRWCPADPYLYTLCGETLKNGTVTDRVKIPFGIRVARFDPDRGFFLNGKSMKIRGVCVHHDAGCLGAAVPKPVWRRRLEKLRAMGCNAVRTAHNPPDPDLLDLCDELGFLVMDEAFDEWEGIKNKWWQGHNVYPPKHYGYGEDFPLWGERDLQSMVERDRNHPCVILWSIGNEIDYPNDPYVTPLFHEVMGNNDADKPLAERIYDIRKPDAGRLASVARRLTELVHRLDDSRPVTSALSFPELSNRTGYADALDIVGYNYREQFYEKDHAAWPGRVILGSENSHDPAAWQAVTDHDFISGQFLWTGVDFLGECPGWPVRISRAGALDLRGKEKPLYAQRQALWTEKPFVRIAVGAGEAEDSGAWGEAFRWDGVPGEKKRISCYTNQREAELFLNGKSLGKKILSAERGGRAAWIAAYEPGELKVYASGVSDILATPGTAVRMIVRLSRAILAADGMQVVQADVELVDDRGNPARDELIRCQILGGLTLLGLENGQPDDLTAYSESFRRTRESTLTAYFRAGLIPGSAAVCFWTDRGLYAARRIRLVPVCPHPDEAE